MKPEILIGDLVALPFRVGAVVNAANEDLAAGGGVCGVIFKAAGPDLQSACDKVAPCPTGEARITPAFDINAEHIIHAVGPIWYGGGQGEEFLLASAYGYALKLADDHACRSIAFPAISTGIYGYPLKAATDIAIKVVREHLAGTTSIEQVVFACFSDEVQGAYRKAGI